MPKTVSARIENNVHHDLLERCNKLGCRVSDYVKASIEIVLYGKVMFDFGTEEAGGDNPEKESTDSPRIRNLELH